VRFAVTTLPAHSDVCVLKDLTWLLTVAIVKV